MPYGVSNSFKRGCVKTYGRLSQRALPIDDGDFPRKKTRMDTDGTVIEEHLNMPVEDSPVIESDDHVLRSSTAPSSSPAPDTFIFSDPGASEDRGTQSPLSSPPPELLSPEAGTKKPTISTFKRKRSLRSRYVSDSGPVPLADIALNLQRRPSRPTKNVQLTQMQIDLGGQVQKTCRTCGMEYIPSNKEDSTLHKEFHAMNHRGVDLGKHFLSSKDGGLKRAYPRTKRWLNEGEEMVVVDRKSPLWARNKIKKVLEIVNTELGSAEIKDEDLWAALAPKAVRLAQPTKRKRPENELSEKAGERFKAFVHMERERCIGFCLVEKISNARRVVLPERSHNLGPVERKFLRSSSITTAVELDVALLGITRIWTSKTHRGQGVAEGLLETARGNFFYGMEVPKELVAFSQPTESGAKLASRWFACDAGWHVYDD